MHIYAWIKGIFPLIPPILSFRRTGHALSTRSSHGLIMLKQIPTQGIPLNSAFLVKIFSFQSFPHSTNEILLAPLCCLDALPLAPPPVGWPTVLHHLSGMRSLTSASVGHRVDSLMHIRRRPWCHHHLARGNVNGEAASSAHLVQICFYGSNGSPLANDTRWTPDLSPELPYMFLNSCCEM